VKHVRRRKKEGKTKKKRENCEGIAKKKKTEKRD